MSNFARHMDIIYCDDIRSEIGNKISLIGVYGGDMLLSTFPAVLPKLCIVITAVTDASDPFQKLSVRITKGENDEVRTDLFSADNVNVAAHAPKYVAGNEARLQQVQVHVVLSPFQIDSPTILRVAVDTEREALSGRALSILPLNAEGMKASAPASATQVGKVPAKAKRRPKGNKKTKY